MKTKIENPEHPKPKEKYMWFGYGYYDAIYPATNNPNFTPNPNMLESLLKGLGFVKNPPGNNSKK